MKTLFICYSYLTGNGGGIYASRAYINAFSEISETTTLIYPTSKIESIEGVNTDKITLFPVEDKRNKLIKGLSLLFGGINRFKNLPEEFFDAKSYDIVVFNNSTCSFKLIKKFNDKGIKTITIHHNYQIDYVKGDSAFYLRCPLLFWTKKFEGTSARHSYLNLTLTYYDAEKIKTAYHSHAPFENIGIFEPSNRSQNTGALTTAHNKNHFVITGGLSDIQTEKSIISWIKVYYPLLKKIIPDAELTIAGKSPSDRLSKCIHLNNINLIPSPNDMNTILSDANYYICPIDRGSGLKLRNMDGLRHGMLVLTHSVSLRGYESLEKLGYVFAYNSPDSFVTSLKQMLESKKEKKDIMNYYNNNFSFDSGVKRLKRIFHKYNLL